MIFLLLIPALAYCDAFDQEVGRVSALRDRAQNLLFRAGGSPKNGKNSREEEGKNTFFKVQALPSSTFIPNGGIAFGKTYFRLLVGGEASPITVTLSPENKYPLLDGAKAHGTASQNRGRVFAEFNRLVLRSGRVIPIQAQALDENGSLGLKGENENSKLLEIAGGVGLGIIAEPEDRTSVFGFVDSARKSAGERVRSSLLQESRDFLREKFKETPVLRVNENTGLTLQFNEEVRF